MVWILLLGLGFELKKDIKFLFKQLLSHTTTLDLWCHMTTELEATTSTQIN